MPEEFNKQMLEFCQAFYTGLEVRLNKAISLKKIKIKVEERINEYT